jgi:hypothetical protein
VTLWPPPSPSYNPSYERLRPMYIEVATRGLSAPTTLPDKPLPLPLQRFHPRTSHSFLISPAPPHALYPPPVLTASPTIPVHTRPCTPSLLHHLRRFHWSTCAARSVLALASPPRHFHRALRPAVSPTHLIIHLLHIPLTKLAYFEQPPLTYSVPNHSPRTSSAITPRPTQSYQPR